MTKVVNLLARSDKSGILHPQRGIEQQVARRAHNPKVAGSSPAPATKELLEKSSAYGICRLYFKKQSFQRNLHPDLLPT